MKSRIAVFEGYGTPFRGMGRRAPKRRRLGGPIFDNPRLSRYGEDLRTMPKGYGGVLLDNPRMGELGRRGYYVPAVDARPARKGYRVKAKRNTPKMRKAMNRFKKAAKSCSRKTKNSRSKGAFQRCMKSALRKKR